MRLTPEDTAVVTGAASGIGLALVRHLLDRGLRVVLADVERAPLAEAAEQLTAAHGDRVLAVPTDVSRADEVGELRDRTLARFGRVDLLCNNAGVTGAGGVLWELDARDWEWALGVNLWGVVHGLHAFLPGMVAQGRGHVLNVASLSGLTAPPFTAPYNATKHAVVGLTETLAAELAAASTGVGASVACPGLVATGIWEAERNRPAGLRHAAPPVHPAYAAFLPVFERLAGGPLEAGEVARRIVDGIEAGRLHVLTHPHLDSHVVARLDSVRSATTPGA